MKPSRPARRPAAGRDDDDGNLVVISLPDLRLLRLVARSVLLAAALLSFPWLRAVRVFSAQHPSPPPLPHEPKWIDTPFLLPMLLADLRREGLLTPDSLAVFLGGGEPGSRAATLTKNRIRPLSSEYRKMMVRDGSVDFLLAVDGIRDPSSFGFVDRVLKVGGAVTVRLGSDSASGSFRLPPNYRVAYIRRFGFTVVAFKKISHANANELNGEMMETLEEG